MRNIAKVPVPCFDFFVTSAFRLRDLRVRSSRVLLQPNAINVVPARHVGQDYLVAIAQSTEKLNCVH